MEVPVIRPPPYDPRVTHALPALSFQDQIGTMFPSNILRRYVPSVAKAQRTVSLVAITPRVLSAGVDKPDLQQRISDANVTNLVKNKRVASNVSDIRRGSSAKEIAQRSHRYCKSNRCRDRATVNRAAAPQGQKKYGQHCRHHLRSLAQCFD